jgi:spore germination protein YaaH
LPTSPRRPAPDRTARTARRLGTSLLAGLVLATSVGITGAGAVAPTTDPAMDQQRPSIHYEESLRHADDDLTFAPGGRVTVGFRPHPGDTTRIGGQAPRALPAGRLSGAELRGGSIPGPAEPVAPAASETPAATDAPAVDAAPASEPPSAPSPSVDPATIPSEPPVPDATAVPPADDAPVVEPEADIAAIPAAYAPPTDDAEPDVTARVTPDGLRKEVFGFLPYWEVDASTVLDYRRLSTIAYFGVGASAAGNLEKTTSSGATTVGWSGWTSSRMTTIINDAHRNSTRVVLTVQSFAWSDGGATKQRTLLGSSTARANLARTIATAVRDRGADGVNLDFEPLTSGNEDEFVALVRRVRTELDAIQKGYQLTFDTTGWIGNYPIEQATASGAADAIMIMGYDYRSAGSSTAGSIAPMGGAMYDIVDTVRAYTARVPGSKLILGVPYYGRAWSTESDNLHSSNISGTKFGASSSVNYSVAVDYLADHGRRYDTVEQVAWTAYRRENCSATYGCVTSWRQLYVDDATALKAKYDLINRYGLRGAGIWALGYDGNRTELWSAISEKFIEDKAPPRAGVIPLPTSHATETVKVTWASDDDVTVVDHDVDVSIDGGAWARWLTRTPVTSATYVGARGHRFAFRVRARDPKGNVSSWASLPVAGGTPTVAVGGFGRVQTDTLNARAAADTSATILDTLTTGDLVAFLQGPVSADGYTWYRVAAPLSEWPVVGTTRSDLWVAVSGGGSTFVGAVAAPNTTRVASDAARVSSNGNQWSPISPARLLDTRAGVGLSGPFRDEVVRTVRLAGRGGIPEDAMAVTANLTVTGATDSGYVSIGPSMTSSPSTSTINVKAGQTAANGLTLRIGSADMVSAVFASSSGASAHLLLDVTGYYRIGTTGSTWYPLTPTRLLDTRSGNGLSGSFKTGVVRTLQVAGRSAIPTDAIAVTGNLTATGASGSGYVSAGPTMTAAPSTSTLNLQRGATRANNVTLRLAAAGSAQLVFVGPAGSSVHLLFDVTGYYRLGDGGAKWYAITPTRLLDTRSGNGLSGQFVDARVRSFQLTGRGTIPVDALAVTANLTAVGPTSAGFVSSGPTMTSSPKTSILNVARNQTVANGLTLRTASLGTVGSVFQSPTSGARIDQVLDVTGYFR